MSELVVLVDDRNNVIGTAEKDTVHTDTTPLHRGFSVFLFNAKNELLLTRRSLNKKTFPGLWTNSVCGHPAPGEADAAAAVRRLKEELGIVTSQVTKVSDYRYRFADQNGIVENEICPVFIARSFAYPIPNEQEVGEWKWMPWGIFLQETRDYPGSYSPWCVEEEALIEKYFAHRNNT